MIEKYYDKYFKLTKEELIKIIKRLEHHEAQTVGCWATDRPDKIPEDIKEKYFWEIKS